MCEEKTSQKYQTCPLCGCEIAAKNWMNNPAIQLPFDGMKSVTDDWSEKFGVVEVHCYGGAGDIGICVGCQKDIIRNMIEFLIHGRNEQAIESKEQTMDEKCGTCCAFEPAHGGAGYCHRFPPQVHVWYTRKEEEVVDGNWPPVNEHEWCCEYRKIKTSDEADA